MSDQRKKSVPDDAWTAVVSPGLGRKSIASAVYRNAGDGAYLVNEIINYRGISGARGSHLIKVAIEAICHIDVPVFIYRHARGQRESASYYAGCLRQECDLRALADPLQIPGCKHVACRTRQYDCAKTQARSLRRKLDIHRACSIFGIAHSDRAASSSGVGEVKIWISFG